MLTAEACRAGRALLGWALEDLASASGIAAGTLSRFENGRPMRRASIERVLSAFSTHHVEIIHAEDRTGAQLVFACRRSGGSKKEAGSEKG